MLLFLPVSLCYSLAWLTCPCAESRLLVGTACIVPATGGGEDVATCGREDAGIGGGKDVATGGGEGVAAGGVEDMATCGVEGVATGVLAAGTGGGEDSVTITSLRRS